MKSRSVEDIFRSYGDIISIVAQIGAPASMLLARGTERFVPSASTKPILAWCNSVSLVMENHTVRNEIAILTDYLSASFEYPFTRVDGSGQIPVNDIQTIAIGAEEGITVRGVRCELSLLLLLTLSTLMWTTGSQLDYRWCPASSCPSQARARRGNTRQDLWA